MPQMAPAREDGLNLASVANVFLKFLANIDSFSARSVPISSISLNLDVQYYLTDLQNLQNKILANVTNVQRNSTKFTFPPNVC